MQERGVCIPPSTASESSRPLTNPGFHDMLFASHRKAGQSGTRRSPAVPEASSRSQKQPGMGFSFVFRLRTSLRLQLTPPLPRGVLGRASVFCSAREASPCPVLWFGVGQPRSSCLPLVLTFLPSMGPILPAHRVPTPLALSFGFPPPLPAPKPELLLPGWGRLE